MWQEEEEEEEGGGVDIRDHEQSLSQALKVVFKARSHLGEDT